MTMSRLSKPMKRRRKINKKLTVPSIYSLPNDMIKEVLARVAASSFTDYFSAKLSCKVFHEFADDKYVVHRVSLEKIFQQLQWRKTEEASSFLKRCKENENPEALYRQGVDDFFSYMRVESALECLQKAVNSGRNGALYALSIIMLCRGNELKQQGMELLNGMNMNKSKGISRRMHECRENLKVVIRRIGIRNSLILEQRPAPCCTILEYQHQKRRKTWCLGDDLQCKACICYEEVASIFNALPNQRLI